MNIDFAAVLVLLTVLTGAVWLLDVLVLAPRRGCWRRSADRSGPVTVVRRSVEIILSRDPGGAGATSSWSSVPVSSNDGADPLVATSFQEQVSPMNAPGRAEYLIAGARQPERGDVVVFMTVTGADDRLYQAGGGPARGSPRIPRQATVHQRPAGGAAASGRHRADPGYRRFESNWAR